MANSEKLKRLFPNASKAFLEANLNSGLQDSQQQRVCGTALDQEIQGKPESYERAHVCFTAFTARPTDPDNIGGGCKALLDAIKKLGLIPDDSPDYIELEIKQRRVDHVSQEKTLIEIQYR